MRKECVICGKKTNNYQEHNGEIFCKLCCQTSGIDAEKQVFINGRDRDFDTLHLKTEDMHALARTFGFKTSSDFANFAKEQQKKQEQR